MALSSPRGSATAYPGVPAQWPNPLQWLFKCAIAINGLLVGRSNNIGTATLGSGTSTVVLDQNVRERSAVHLMPEDATAESAAAYIGTVANGTFTITHATGKDGGVFRYSVHG